MTRSSYVVEVDFFEFLQTAQTTGDGLEVGEHTAQPALVHEWLTNALCLFGNRFLGLLLGTDEHDRSAVRNGFFDELECGVDVAQRLL